MFLFLAFLWMLLLWNEGSPYWQIALAYIFIGVGVGLAGTPASHSLTGSVPVTRAGMASGTADLQRDLGGAIMQSIFGALLTAGYASAVSAQIAASDKDITDSTRRRSSRSRSRAPRRSRSSTRSTRTRSSPARSRRSSTATTGRTPPASSRSLLGAVLVFFMFPKHDEERRLLAAYHAQDTAAEPGDLERRVPAPPLPAREPVGGPAARRCARLDLRPRLGRSRRRRQTSRTRWEYSASTAEAVLAAVVAASVGLVGFVVTVSVLIVQMATGTFSARYMRIFYRDWAFKAVLAVLIGTFTFSYTLMRHVEEDAVPNLGVTFAGAFLGLGILLFVVFLDRAIHRLRPVAVAALVAKAGRQALREVLAEAATRGRTRRRPAPYQRTGRPALVVRMIHGGAIQAIDFRGLGNWAHANDEPRRAAASVGDFVSAGAALIERLRA